jgi:hypothetical protein
VVSVDTSFTEKEENDPTGCTTWGLWTDPTDGFPKVMLLAAWRKHLQLHGVEQEPLRDRRLRLRCAVPAEPGAPQRRHHQARILARLPAHPGGKIPRHGLRLRLGRHRLHREGGEQPDRLHGWGVWTDPTDGFPKVMLLAAWPSASRSTASSRSCTAATRARKTTSGASCPVPPGGWCRSGTSAHVQVVRSPRKSRPAELVKRAGED